MIYILYMYNPFECKLIFTLLVVILQCALLGMVFYITTQPCLNFDPTDTTAMMFCSSHKSLTLGKID